MTCVRLVFAPYPAYSHEANHRRDAEDKASKQLVSHLLICAVFGMNSDEDRDLVLDEIDRLRKLEFKDWIDHCDANRGECYQCASVVGCSFCGSHGACFPMDVEGNDDIFQTKLLCPTVKNVTWMLEGMRCPEAFVCNYVCPSSDWSAYSWIMWVEWLFFLMIYLTVFFVFPVLVASAVSVIRQRRMEGRRKTSSSHYSFQSFQAD